MQGAYKYFGEAKGKLTKRIVNQSKGNMLLPQVAGVSSSYLASSKNGSFEYLKFKVEAYNRKRNTSLEDAIKRKRRIKGIETWGIFKVRG